MGVQRIRTGRVWSPGSDIDDTLDPEDHDTSAESLQDTLDYICSQIRRISGKARWEDQVAASIADLAVELEPDRSSFSEFLYTDGTLTSVITWTSPSKVGKIVQSDLAYTDGVLTQVEKFVYDDDGVTISETITKTLSYGDGGDLESVLVEVT